MMIGNQLLSTAGEPAVLPTLATVQSCEAIDSEEPGIGAVFAIVAVIAAIVAAALTMLLYLEGAEPLRVALAVGFGGISALSGAAWGAGAKRDNALLAGG